MKKHVTHIDPKRKATAPYNFIPLNATVIASPVTHYKEQERYIKDALTGYIDVTLTALTQVFIGGGGQDGDVMEFYAPDGTPRIPGSSLRGMTRTLVEILGYGEFGTYEDQRLYFRGVAGRSNLPRYYKTILNDETVEAGYFRKKGVGYVIQPAKKERGKSFDKKKRRKVTELLQKEGKQREDFSQHYLEDGRSIVISGPMPGKKHDWVINAPDEDARPINLTEGSVKDYRTDFTRHDDTNLIKKLDTHRDQYPKGIPCFYVTQENHRVLFGHTRNFRLGYDHTIGGFIPEEINSQKDNGDNIDIATGMFGRIDEEQSFAGRLYFEDALLDTALSPDPPIASNPIIPKTLLSPKPTSFQHYLVQESQNKKDLKHYGEKDTAIRGNKMYWHRAPETKSDDSENVDKKVKPAERDCVFKGRIFFDNLHRVELGALLFALDLPEEMGHKIGMGKPVGFGSVDLDIALTLSDRTQRYTRLFSQDSWALAESSQSFEDIQELKTTFEQAVLDQLPDTERYGAQQLFETPRLRELATLLTIGDLRNTDSDTTYMELTQFIDRPVLPVPTEVRNRN